MRIGQQDMFSWDERGLNTKEQKSISATKENISADFRSVLCFVLVFVFFGLLFIVLSMK